MAWLSLEPGDNDPTRFWRYVVAALDGAGAGAGSVTCSPRCWVGRWLAGGGRHRALNGLADCPIGARWCWTITTSSTRRRSTRASGSCLTACRASSRWWPAGPIRRLPLARLRVRGQLVELRGHDLRFTEDETAALLRETTGLDLPSSSLAALSTRTEGWVAGLQLAALLLQGRSDPAGFVASFSGSHRYVLDYLTEEVLARQPDQLVRFLLETSILGRLSGPLCDAVTGQGAARPPWSRSSGPTCSWFPWTRNDAGGATTACSPTCCAPVSSTQIPTVCRCCTATRPPGWRPTGRPMRPWIMPWLPGRPAGPPGWSSSTARSFQHSEGATVDRWLSALPAEVVQTRPRLSLSRAIWALIGGRVDEVEPLLAQAEHAHADGERSTGPRPAGTPTSLQCWRSCGPSSLASTVTLTRRLRSPGRPCRTSAGMTGSCGISSAGTWPWRCCCRAGPARPSRRLPRSPPIGGRPGSPITPCAPATPAAKPSGPGRLGAALATCRQGLERAEAAGQAALPASAGAHLGLAEILRERNELEGALDHATEGAALCRQLGYAQWQVTSLAALAWIRQACGNQPGALEAIGEAERVLPSQELVTDLIFPAAVQRVRLLLAQGQLAAVFDWVAARGLTGESKPDYAHERESLVLVRLRIAQQTPDQALPLLERLHYLALAQGRVGSRIEVRVLQALALAAAGEEAHALDALAEALTLGCPEGYVRVFVDEGALIADLLAKLIAARRTDPMLAAGVPAGYLRQLMDAINQESPIPILRQRGAAAGLVEPLSARELEVLELAAGRANQQIADELVLALDTVKKHVSHILDKLGASNRTEAVTHARDLGLIP